jgi:hypothetical protein
MVDVVHFTGSFTQPGDTLRLEFPLGRHSLTLTASVSGDPFMRPDEEESMSEEHLAAWRRGDWQYLGVEVAMAINGEEIACASLWGIDVGDDPRYLLCVANDLLAGLPLPLRVPGYEAAYAPLSQPRG